MYIDHMKYEISLDLCDISPILEKFHGGVTLPIN